MKCDGIMQQGFVADVTHGAVYVSEWVSGPPEKKFFWDGVKRPNWFTESFSNEPKKRIPIGAFRCESCGFLEVYSRDEFAAQ